MTVGSIYTKLVIEARFDFREKSGINQEFFAILFTYRGDKNESPSKKTVRNLKIKNVFLVTFAPQNQVLA